ncbi:hypothetical protein [Roseiconus lacunae]|uniref:hypothetical protein n=1 Tax=Roseiconus lacunae TaxID=2605694 RepID=UPI001E6585EA|nr:hypothetical protein [Roseiconus lacunae]MCD0461726.1 hypothetical protein [Roseiconus lacunae]
MRCDESDRVTSHKTVRRDYQRRAGQTMLELIAATTIISVAIVPALRLIRQRIEVSSDLRHYEWLHCRCVAKVEQAMARTSASWLMTTQQGVLGNVDRTPFRYALVTSDQPSAGGVPGKLAVIDVLAYRDQNRNGTFDSNEIKVRLATKVAKTLTYQEIANDR